MSNKIAVKDNDKKVLQSLLANKDFRDWVHFPTENRDLYWQKWIEGNKEHAELTITARNAVQRLKFKEEQLQEERMEEILNKVISDEASNSHHRMTHGKHSGVKLWFMVAASFAVLTLSALLIHKAYSNQESLVGVEVAMKHIYNPVGRKSIIKLPDGSTVNLNSDSHLSFPPRFSDSVRVVVLQGEAYFDVAKESNRPFIVKTLELYTKVLGTQFNVRAYGHETYESIALLDGQVEVVGNTQELEANQGILIAGEKLKYNRSEKSYKKSPFDSENETGWKDGVLVFNNTNFNGFVTLIERWYGVQIQVDKRPSKVWSVHGRFKNESLEEVLLGVKFSYGVDYNIFNNTVRISCE